MKKFLAFFIHRPMLVNIMMIMVVLTGMMGLSTLSYNSFPPVDSGLISVTTNHPGASAEDIERFLLEELPSMGPAPRGPDRTGP